MHSSSSSSSGGNEEPSWRRCRFKVAGKRWTLCSDRVALSAQAAPMPLASVGTGANSSRQHNQQQSGRDSGASSAASSPTNNKGRQYGKYGAASAMSSSLSVGSSCKSVVAAFARAGAAAAISRGSSRTRNSSSEEREKKDGGYGTSIPGGDSMTLLVLGNESGIGIFDAAHVEDVRQHPSSSHIFHSPQHHTIPYHTIPCCRSPSNTHVYVHQNDDDNDAATRRLSTRPCD